MAVNGSEALYVFEQRRWRPYAMAVKEHNELLMTSEFNAQ
jgi:hypothetical protein